MLRLILLLRGFFLMIFVVIHTLIFSILTIVFGGLFGAKDFAFSVVDKYFWARPILWLSGIEIEVRGLERLPDGGGLYLFNHTSYNDIIAIVAGIPRVPKFGAKKELFSIPFFGAAMRAIGALEIARDQREKVLKIYQDAEKRVAKGETFALAPEGTRQRGGQLGRFKTGPFIFAVNAKMPAIPLVIAGAEQTQAKGEYMINTKAWKRKIILETLDPVNGADYSKDTMREFQEKVRSEMDVVYHRLLKELGYE